MAIAIGVSLLGHSVALAYLGWLPQSLRVHWVPVQSGRASIALTASMACTPQKEQLAAEEVELAVEQSFAKPTVPVLDAALAETFTSTTRRRETQVELASVVPMAVSSSVPLPPSELVKPYEGAPRVEASPEESAAEESSGRKLPPRRDVARQRLTEMTVGSAASAASASSKASHGAENAPPAVVYNPAPSYPAEALASRITGRAVVLVRLDAEGKVVDAQIHRSSGTTSLDKAAIESVRCWRFEAAAGIDNRQLLVPIRFLLADS